MTTSEAVAPRASRDPTRSVSKRSLDLAVAAFVAVLAAPVAVLIALVIRVTMGSPVIYRQRRPGLRAVPFTLLKFRTMRPAPAGGRSAAVDEGRVTGFGAFLRRTSLDELPELVNVLRGDMSLVGPRPLLMEYLDRYSPRDARRHEVKPGITGWAQVNGRNALTWERRFELDVWYVDHRSFGLDLRILARTPRAVLTGDGIRAPGHATMPDFQGYRSQEG